MTVLPATFACKSAISRILVKSVNTYIIYKRKAAVNKMTEVIIGGNILHEQILALRKDQIRIAKTIFKALE